jgi:predicted RNase H-like nuclease (RuvC/YqgF family)
MQLDGVDTVQPDPDAYKELDQLTKDVEYMESQVERQKRSVSSTSGSSGYSSRSYRSNRTSRQGRAQGELLADYQKQYNQKRGEMKRLERELKEPRQVILGNWNNKIITLRTTQDVSRTLNRIDSGAYLSWQGRRVYEDRDSQEWVVTSIKAVDASDLPR